MAGRYGVLSSGGPACRFGRLVAAGWRHDLPPFVTRPYRRLPEWVLCLVQAGSGEFESGASRSPVTAPAVILVPPGTAHWYGSASGGLWTETWAVVTSPLFDALASDPDVRAGTVRPVSPADASAVRLRTVLRRPVPFGTAAQRQLLDLAGWVADAVPERPAAGSAPVRTARERLATDLADRIPMTRVASELALGYDAFRRMFRAEVGCSPLAYRTSCRVDAAARLLRTTDLTLAAIARETGFSDEFHLSRRFRALRGVPPSVFREQPVQ